MQTYESRVLTIGRSLGIPDDYSEIYGLAIQMEETNLVAIENDIYGRPQKLTPHAAEAWHAMRKNAEKDNIHLYTVSAFRSVRKQMEIVRKKIASDQPLSEILKVCAAPGYSEHHTGRAIDVTTINCQPLSESFETTEAFNWLQENAIFHSFKLSYPKKNEYGIAYEPWHWAYVPD